MSSTAVRYLILPGWQGSPAEHWQSHWQEVLPNCTRVEQQDWLNPDPAKWVQALDKAITAAPTPVILVAHSLGCITVARWAKQASSAALCQVKGALLVAPADVERALCPAEIACFAPIPTDPLPFASLIVGSDTDKAASAARVIQWSRQWQAPAVVLANAGHINVQSGHTRWEQGFAYLYRLQRHVDWALRRLA